MVVIIVVVIIRLMAISGSTTALSAVCFISVS